VAKFVERLGNDFIRELGQEEEAEGRPKRSGTASSELPQKPASWLPSLDITGATRTRCGNGSRPSEPRSHDSARQGESADSPQGSPEQYPVPPPLGFQAADHSSVLQSVMEMQKTLGTLTAHIDTQIKSQDKLAQKVDTVNERLHSAEKKL
jgi:hypothetical protein